LKADPPAVLFVAPVDDSHPDHLCLVVAERCLFSAQAPVSAAAAAVGQDDFVGFVPKQFLRPSR
jgi:hypothetical protein